MTTLSLRDLGFVGGLTVASSYDTDAQSYITAVETADGQSLETPVKDAINAFVVGCKNDGIWTAIKASCILAGARTLAGALVPLVGTAPTNNNFVSADYNRKTGLVGNGTSKYLNSNRAGNADPQNNCHAAIYGSTLDAIPGIWIGAASSSFSDKTASMFHYAGSYTYNFGSQTANYGITASLLMPNFVGGSRTSSNNLDARYSGTSGTLGYTTGGQATPSMVTVFAFNAGGTVNSFSTARLAFYSIGQSLNIAQLDSRVTTLIAALAAAIP